MADDNKDKATTQSTSESAASETFYAWSPIDYGAEFEKDPAIPGGRVVTKRKILEMGEEVTAEKLNLTENQFAQLVESGAVKTLKYPKELHSDLLSPREVMMDMHRLTEGNIAAGYFAPDVIEQLQQHAAAREAEFAKAQEARANPASPSGTPEI